MRVRIRILPSGSSTNGFPSFCCPLICCPSHLPLVPMRENPGCSKREPSPVKQPANDVSMHRSQLASSSHYESNAVDSGRAQGTKMVSRVLVFSACYRSDCLAHFRYVSIVQLVVGIVKRSKSMHVPVLVLSSIRMCCVHVGRHWTSGVWEIHPKYQHAYH